jgi:SAM-dependent methyltransferase
MRVTWDAFGYQLVDYAEGRTHGAVLERADGHVQPALDADFFFAERHAWDAYEQRAIDAVRGRVLDVGCGAGRHALDLQSRDHDVVAIDVSPVAVELCGRRGVRDARVMPFTRASKRALGTFDTILLMCGNFGLFETPERAQRLLRRLDGMTSRDARIIADSVRTRPDGASGPYPGKVRIRIRYKTWATPWFDYLNVSPDEMRSILDGTPWQIEDVLDDGGDDYAAVLRKHQ